MSFAPRILNDHDLQSLGVGASEIVEAIEKTVLDLAEGRLVTTPKSVIQPGDGRYMMTTLASGDAAGLTIVKAVTVCPDNPSKGLPSITGAIMVLDAQTGECLAVMDAEWITAVRTAGLSAVAAKRMADPDSRAMGFVGAGVQARSHLSFFRTMFPLEKILISGRGQENIDALCRLAHVSGLEAVVCDDPQEVLAADIVVSSIPLTYAGTPFLDARRMKPNALAIVTDAAKPWTPEGRSAFATVVVDDVAQEASMSEPVVPVERITGDLTDLVAGRLSLIGGPNAFMFRGIAAGDYALAAYMWTKCGQRPN
jgi:ornithine cyclodeaminase/alanine dehydrogenase